MNLPTPYAAVPGDDPCPTLLATHSAAIAHDGAEIEA